MTNDRFGIAVRTELRGLANDLAKLLSELTVPNPPVTNIAERFVSKLRSAANRVEVLIKGQRAQKDVNA